MLKTKALTAGLLMAVASTASAAPYGYFDARSVAMGNVSVATGGLTTAALANPAMLASNPMDEKFVFHIGVGVAAIENGDVVDSIDEIDEIEAQLNSQLAAADTAGAAATMEKQRLLLLELTKPGTNALLDGNANTALVYSGDDYTFAFSFKGRVTAGVGLRNPTDLGLPITVANVAGLDPSVDVLANAVLTQEIGLSISRKLTLAGMDFSIGLRPKTVSVESADYLVSTNNDVELGDASDNTQDLGSFTSFDGGIVLEISDSMNVGLYAENIMSKTLTTAPTMISPTSRNIEFDTKLRAGVSYQNEFVTVAADLDLTESDPILDESASKVLALGVEFDLGDIVQLRAGYQTNTAGDSNDDDLLSAGVGLWLGFNLDVAAVLS